MNDLSNWAPVPKIAAALLAAVAILITAAIAQLVGIDVMSDARSALVIVIAALGPVITGYLKS
jgi:hypothetical protein